MVDHYDSLGDALKAMEKVEAGRRANPRLPLIARLDGRAFHTLTRGLKRPFDPNFVQLMQETLKHLVHETHALVGYCQSDEITLCWDNSALPEDDPSEYLFGGKFQKLTSVLAGQASAYFARKLPDFLPSKEKELPHFDCRVWNVPDSRTLYLNFLWRQEDAIKNSISMAAQAHFSHKRLNGVGSEEKKRLLAEIGHPWENEPMELKYGTFARRRVVEAELSPEELARLPEKHRPTGPVLRKRSQVELFCLEHLGSVESASELLFGR